LFVRGWLYRRQVEKKSPTCNDVHSLLSHSATFCAGVTPKNYEDYDVQDVMIEEVVSMQKKNKTKQENGNFLGKN
jgi:hypothetical protein